MERDCAESERLLLLTLLLLGATTTMIARLLLLTLLLPSLVLALRTPRPAAARRDAAASTRRALLAGAAAAALLEVAPARADGNVTVIPSTLATRDELEALDRSRQAMPPPETVIPKGSDLDLMMLGSSAGALDPRAHSGP